MQLRKLSALVGTALSVSSATAHAEEWEGARSAGRGGTGLANGNDVGAIAENVATIALSERYDLGGGGVAGPDDTWLGRIAAVDSRTSLVTLGASYTFRTDDVPPATEFIPGWTVLGEAITNTTSHQGVTLGMAYPLANRKVALGLTGRYDWRASETSGESNGFNVSLSAAARPLAPLTLALAINNALDLGYEDTRRLVDLGVRWEPGPYLGLEGELTTEWMGDPFEESLAEHVGVDFGVTEWLRLGAGWQHEDGLHQVGGGLALVSDKAELDYSLVADVDAEPARLWHGIDVRLHF